MSKKRLIEKDINLLDVYKQKKEASVTPLAKLMLFPCIAILLLGSLFAFFTIKNNNIKKENDKMTAEIAKLQDENTNHPELEKYNALTDVNNQITSYQKFYDDLLSYPVLTQKTFDQILIAEGIDVNVVDFSYTREFQTISLQIQSSAADQTEMFVRRLKNTDVFTNVTYSGYSRTEITENDSDTSQKSTDSEAKTIKTKIVYTATVLCVLK